MSGPFENFSQEDLHAAALKLEKVVKSVNAALLKVGFIDQDKLMPTVIDVYSEILRFDSFTKRRFEQSVEEKKVRTLAQGGVIMTCVMTAAVALSELKNLPKPVQQNLLQKGLHKLKEKSSHPMSLAGLSLAGFYGLMGRGIFLRAKSSSGKTVIADGVWSQIRKLKEKIR
jgi:hypothetical protein